jgi:biopolymer transport protein ExbD
VAILNKKQKVSDEIPSASMADIAFLLLIFFLVTTVFPKDRGLPIVLPEAQEEVEVSQRNILHIDIMTNGTVQIGGATARTAPRSRPARSSRSGGSRWPRTRTSSPRSRRIPDAQHRYMIQVLDGLQLAGAERISLQMQEGG